MNASCVGVRDLVCFLSHWVQFDNQRFCDRMANLNIIWRNEIRKKHHKLTYHWKQKRHFHILGLFSVEENKTAV